MKIQNFTCVDSNGNKRYFDFEDLITKYAQQYEDMGLCDRFQVLVDSPTRAVWRFNQLLGADDSYLGTFWIIDTETHTLEEGTDCSDSTRTFSYKAAKVNCVPTHTYTIITE